MGGESPKKASSAALPKHCRPRGLSSRRFFLPVWRWESKRKVPAEPLSVRTPRLADGVGSHGAPAAGAQGAHRDVWSLPPLPSEADVNPPHPLYFPEPKLLPQTPRVNPCTLGGFHTGWGTQIYGKRKCDDQREGPRCVVICHSGPRKPTWLAARCPGSRGGQSRVVGVPGQHGPALLAFSAGAAGLRLEGGEATSQPLPHVRPLVREPCAFWTRPPHFAKQPKSHLQEGHPSALPAGHRPPGFTGCPASPSRREPGLRSGAVPGDAEGQRGAAGPLGARPSSECVPWAVATAIKAQSPACLRRSPRSSSGFLRL